MRVPQKLLQQHHVNSATGRKDSLSNQQTEHDDGIFNVKSGHVSSEFRLQRCCYCRFDYFRDIFSIFAQKFCSTIHIRSQCLFSLLLVSRIVSICSLQPKYTSHAIYCVFVRSLSSRLGGVLGEGEHKMLKHVRRSHPLARVARV
jgi:hypothetical protein